MSRKGAGVNIELAAGIKKEVSIPVTVVGRLDAELGEKVLREGKADFIGMTRRLHADPEYPKKVALRAGWTISRRAPPATPVSAAAAAGSMLFSAADHNTIEKASKKKKVVVIGGGPAGMEAARVSALRGHDVTLFEKSHQLGGLLQVAAMVKGNHPEDLSLIVTLFRGTAHEARGQGGAREGRPVPRKSRGSSPTQSFLQRAAYRRHRG